jgi:hypothetical protein
MRLSSGDKDKNCLSGEDQDAGDTNGAEMTFEGNSNKQNMMGKRRRRRALFRSAENNQPLRRLFPKQISNGNIRKNYNIEMRQIFAQRNERNSDIRRREHCRMRAQNRNAAIITKYVEDDSKKCITLNTGTE